MIKEAEELAVPLGQKEFISLGPQDFHKLQEINRITTILIRPHWKQIAPAKPAQRQACYQLAKLHAETLISNDHSLEKHRGESPAWRSRDQQLRESDYRKTYGIQFDAEIAQLLSDT